MTTRWAEGGEWATGGEVSSADVVCGIGGGVRIPQVGLSDRSAYHGARLVDSVRTALPRRGR